MARTCHRCGNPVARTCGYWGLWDKLHRMFCSARCRDLTIGKP